MRFPRVDEESCNLWIPIALAMTSGAAGLMHQLLWVRRMVDILGANAGTFSRVTGSFFLGLAVGAWLASRWRTPSPWKSVALAELGVALLAALVLLAGEWVQLGAMGRISFRVLQWILPLALITPPAMAMGAVLPWMLRAVPPRLTVALYGFNTLGGLAGLAIAGAWALPALGLSGASIAALSLNLIVSFAAWMTGTSAPKRNTSADWKSVQPTASDSALAFCSGFLVLGAEVLYQHQFAQFLISSHFAGALVLGLLLAGLGAGAFLVPLIARLGNRAFSLVLAAAAISCALQPFILVVQRGGLIFLPFNRTHAEYLFSAIELGIPGCVVTVVAAACVFPLVLRRNALVGADTGRLLAINGFGGWFGAECAERLIAPVFGLWYGMAVLACGYVLCLAWQRSAMRLCLIPMLAGMIACAWKIDTRLPFAALNQGEILVRVAVGREGVVGVVHGAPDDWRIIFNNTYTLGGSRAQFNQERQMLLPMLLHGDARRVATLGVATGSSLAGATLDPVLESAEGIELSPLVLRYAHEYFAPFNRHVTHDARVHLTVGDARIEIAKHPASFDVIEGDLFLPWRTGEARLFTLEHFANVRAALRPGGLYCQWLPTYQLTRSQFEAILRSFRETFPEAWLVRGDFYVGRPIIGLIGGRSLQEMEWVKVAEACDRVRAANRCRDPLLRHVEGVAMCVLGPAPVPPDGPINTLSNAWLEWDAARNVIGQQENWFTGLPLANYLRKAQRAAENILPTDLQAAQNVGDLCVALEIARTVDLPHAAETEARLRIRLSSALLEDPGADWQCWPMRFRPSLP